MPQPICTEEQSGRNPIVMSSWGVNGNGILAISAEVYKEGSLLGKDANGDYELTTDATKVDAVLLADVDATTAKRNAPIQTGGEIDEDQLILGGTLTLDDVRDPLRDKNIYLRKRG